MQQPMLEIWNRKQYWKNDAELIGLFLRPNRREVSCDCHIPLPHFAKKGTDISNKEEGRALIKDTSHQVLPL